MKTVTRLAYLDFCKFDPDYIRAGVLVTNETSDPIEFRCTNPVRPTRLQQLLWGGRLKGHLFCQVFGKPLIDSLTPPPDLVLTRTRQLLDLRALLGLPVACISDKPEQNSHPLPGPHTVHLCTAPGYAGDAELALPTLSVIAGVISPLEPFTRVVNALQDVQKDETRAKAV